MVSASGSSVNVLHTINKVSCYFPQLVFLSRSKSYEFSHSEGTHSAIVAIIEIKSFYLKKIFFNPLNRTASLSTIYRETALWAGAYPALCFSFLSCWKRRIPFRFSWATPLRLCVRTSSTTATFSVTAQSWRSRSKCCKRWVRRSWDAGKSVIKHVNEKVNGQH